MSKLKNVMIIALLAVACFAIIRIGYMAKAIQDTATESSKLVRDTNQKMDGTFRNVNAILIQTGLIAARVEDASRTLRESSVAQTKYWNDITKSTAHLMDSANASIGNLTEVTASLNGMVKHTDDHLNNHLFPAGEESILEVKNSLTTISESAKMLTTDSRVVIADLHKVLADENWQRTVKGMSDTTNNAALASAEVAQAAKELPSIAKSMEKIAKTSSKWQKLQIPVSIMSLIWRTFF